MTTLANIYRLARSRLQEAGLESAALDARLLVEGLGGVSTQDIVCHPTRPVEAVVHDAVEQAIARRIAGEPVYRILGWREFYGLKLALNADTLEPRPDTETLVDTVLPFVRAAIARNGSCSILDLGTGSGAVPLALLSQAPEAFATATDIAPGALAAARSNAETLGLGSRFSVVQSNWFENVAGQFDVIVSNPPYIRSDVIAGLDAGVRAFDPMLALDGGRDGLDAYRTIVEGAPFHLADHGVLALEIGFDQAESVTQLLLSAGFAIEPVIRDLGGNDRVLLTKMRQ